MGNKSWKDNNLIDIIDDDIKYRFYPRFTETNINRVMGHGKDGFVIISTARSTVIPYIDPDYPDLGYDYNSWQSLFDEYCNYCSSNNLPIFTYSNSIEEGINTKDTLNRESSNLFLKNRNSLCDKEFWKYLRSKENIYTYTPSLGGYVAKNNNESSSREPSFIVYNSVSSYKNGTGSWKDLKAKALSWCKKYKQDSVYVQAPNKAPIYLDKDGNKVNSTESLNFKFNRPGQYYSSVGRKIHPNYQPSDDERFYNMPVGRTFTADINFEENSKLLLTMRLRAHQPGSLNDGIKWSHLGEIWKLD